MHEKWRTVFCEYAATKNNEIMEKAKAAWMQYKQNQDDTSDEIEFLIRNQSEIDRLLLLGRAEHHCAEIERVLTEQAKSHVAGVEQALRKHQWLCQRSTSRGQ